MKVVWLCPEFPYPPNTGGRLVLFNRLKYSSEQGQELYLFITYKGKIEESEIRELNKYVKKIFLYSRDKIKWFAAIKSVINNKPYAAVSRYYKDIDSQISLIKPDYIVAEMPQMLINLSKKTCEQYKVILEEQNIEWESMFSLASACKNNGLKKIMYLYESNKLKKYELNTLKNKLINKIIFLTQEDIERYPIGKNIKKIVARPGAANYNTPHRYFKKNILFVANYGYYPNEIGANWLINEIVPKVVEKEPEAKFYLVGKNPSQYMLEASKRNNNIIVTGMVDELKDYYNLSDIVVLPIFNGGGVKMKALEASSCGRPIVSTSFALIGTGLIPGVHVLSADEPFDFSNIIIHILNNQRQYAKISSNCFRYFIDELSWDVSNLKWYKEVFG